MHQDRHEAPSQLELVAANGIDISEPTGQEIHAKNLELVRELRGLDDESGAKRLDRLITENTFFDGQTGLFNRRFLDFFLERHYRRLAQAEKSRRFRDSSAASPILTAVEYDVNNFKAFNDELGYDVGNELIQALAEVLKSSTRNTDFQFRLHGDEHAVIYEEGTDLEQAAIATRRTQLMATEVIPDKIEGYLKGFPKRLEIYQEKFAGKITVSAGIARVTPEIDVSPAKFLERLDEALHRAKTDPRNNNIGIFVFDPRTRPEPFLVMSRAPTANTATPAIRR